MSGRTAAIIPVDALDDLIATFNYVDEAELPEDADRREALHKARRCLVSAKLGGDQAGVHRAAREARAAAKRYADRVWLREVVK